MYNPFKELQEDTIVYIYRTAFRDARKTGKNRKDAFRLALLSVFEAGKKSRSIDKTGKSE